MSKMIEKPAAIFHLMRGDPTINSNNNNNNRNNNNNKTNIRWLKENSLQHCTTKLARPNSNRYQMKWSATISNTKLNVFYYLLENCCAVVFQQGKFKSHKVKCSRSFRKAKTTLKKGKTSPRKQTQKQQQQ